MDTTELLERAKRMSTNGHAEKKVESGYEAVALVLSFPFVMASIVGGLILSGWAGSHLWAWFVAPVFGLGPIGIAQVIGLRVAYSVIFGSRSASEKKSDASKSPLEKMWAGVLIQLAVPLACFGIGWLIHLFL